MPDQASAALRPDLGTHLVDDVLAWWLRNGPDEEYGGVFTCWDNRGERLASTDKYTWSQGRWIWLTARLAQAVAEGTLPPSPPADRRQPPLDADHLLALARSTGTFVRTHAMLSDGTTAYVTDRTGTPREPTPGAGYHTSVFADCFVALGLAALARVDGDPEAGQAAEALLGSADHRIEAGRPRTDPYPVHPDFRSFALPMILVGTATEVHQATGSDRSAQIAVRAARTIDATFRQGDDIVELQGRVDGRADTLLARHRTPGHVLECLWFLAHAADAVPGVAEALGDANEWLPAVACRALALGWDDPAGGLLRYVDLDGGEPKGRLLDDPYEQLVRDTWDTKLWWPHAEALYATALLEHRAPGELRPELASWHERLRAYTFATFPAGPGREWVQVRDRDGTPLDRTVALPVKDPFHIARALLLLVELEKSTERMDP